MTHVDHQLRQTWSEIERPFEDHGPRCGPPDAVILDIGQSIGAVIVYGSETCLGSEIDLTPSGAPRSHHLHTMFRRRRVTDRDVIAGVFPEVEEGTYTLWGLHGTGPLGEVLVVGGQVSEYIGNDCRGASLPKMSGG